MPELPIRERILQALSTRVGGVRGLEQFDLRDLPQTVLVEGEESADDGTYDDTNVSMPVTVGRALKISGVKGDDWYEQGNKALADLIQEVYVGGEDLGGLAKGIDYTGGGVDVITDGAKGLMVQASFNVRYAYKHGNPYSQTD